MTTTPFKTAVRKGLALGLCAALAGPELALGPLWAAETARLSGLDVSPDQVKISVDQNVRYNAFSTAKPPRLILELLDTRNDMPQKDFAGRGTYLRRVRTGQYQSVPTSITRIVMDLAEAVSYKVLQEAGALRVVMEAGAAAGGAEGEPAAPDEAPARDAVAASALPSADNVESMLKNSDAPQDISTEVAVGGGRLLRPAGRRAARDIMQNLPRELISLDFDSTDIRDVLKLLAARVGINIIWGQDVSGPISVHLDKVPFNEAFTTVLQMRGLVTQQMGENILRVLTPMVLNKERGDAVTIVRTVPLNYTKADDLKLQLDAVRNAEGRTKGQTIAAKQTNSIVIVDTAEGMEGMLRLVGELDKKPKQVLIEAKLVEVQLNKGFDYGIQWAGRKTISDAKGTTFLGMGDKSNKLEFADAMGTKVGETPFPITAADGGTGVNLPANRVFGSLLFARLTGDSFLQAVLTAAASQGKVKVLSDPKVATLNNQEATINITTQIPYVTASVASTGVTTQNVAYATVGITLVVTPTINADGRVTLKVKPTVSQQSAIAAANTATGAPAVDTRTADTTVLVKDGETVVIGGLIQDSIQEVTAKVPFLGDLPLIGWLFKKISKTRQRQELLVFVTPKIMVD